MESKFNPGDIVRYTTAFRRNTGQYASDRINGKVDSINPGEGRSFVGWPRVIWNDDPEGEAKLVNPVNLERDPRGA